MRPSFRTHVGRVSALARPGGAGSPRHFSVPGVTPRTLIGLPVMTQPELKVTLHQLLKVMTEKGASDMHITTGTPPLLRIDGSIVPLKLPPLSPVDTKQL